MKIPKQPSPDLVRRIVKFGLSPFSGKYGIRREIIRQELEDKTGLKSRVDAGGNLWFKKGIGDKSIVITSHMDTVFGALANGYSIEINGGSIKGTLDNCAGCVINAELLEKVDPEYTTYFVFTVEEECGNHGAWAIKDAVRNGRFFGEHRASPSLFVALDVTKENMYDYNDNNDNQYCGEYYYPDYNPGPYGYTYNTHNNMGTAGFHNNAVPIKSGFHGKSVASIDSTENQRARHGNSPYSQSIAKTKKVGNMVFKTKADGAEPGADDKNKDGHQGSIAVAQAPEKVEQTIRAYAENFGDNDELKKKIKETVDKFKLGDVLGVRSLATADEATVFNSDYNAFALGPVVTGYMHSKDCETKLGNLETVVEFMRGIMTDKGFLESLPKIKKKVVTTAYSETASKYSPTPKVTFVVNKKDDNKEHEDNNKDKSGRHPKLELLTNKNSEAGLKSCIILPGTNEHPDLLVDMTRSGYSLTWDEALEKLHSENAFMPSPKLFFEFIALLKSGLKSGKVYDGEGTELLEYKTSIILNDILDKDYRSKRLEWLDAEFLASHSFEKSGPLYIESNHFPSGSNGSSIISSRETLYSLMKFYDAESVLIDLKDIGKDGFPSSGIKPDYKKIKPNQNFIFIPPKHQLFRAYAVFGVRPIIGGTNPDRKEDGNKKLEFSPYFDCTIAKYEKDEDIGVRRIRERRPVPDLEEEERQRESMVMYD